MKQLKYVLLVMAMFSLNESVLADRHLLKGISASGNLRAHMTHIHVKQYGYFDIHLFLGEHQGGSCQKKRVFYAFPNKLLNWPEYGVALYREDLEAAMDFSKSMCAIEEYRNKKTGDLTTVEYRIVKAQDSYGGMTGEPDRANIMI